jgi:uncharacterized membrane protein YedE/YeeE
MPLITAGFAGLLFGLGLLLSGMTDPARVQGFLDLAGAWNTSLAWVMGGAIAVAAPTYAWARTRTHSVLNEPMQMPARQPVSRRLVLGSLAFGAGWGLAGFCPGPALLTAAAGHAEAWVFVAAMLVGMALPAGLERLRAAFQKPAT